MPQKLLTKDKAKSSFVAVNNGVEAKKISNAKHASTKELCWVHKKDVFGSSHEVSPSAFVTPSLK